MILPKDQIRAILKGKREIRFPDDYEHPVEEGPNEVAPVRAAAGREPVCWVVVKAWTFDDETGEYVVEVERAPAPDTPRLLTSRTPVERPRICSICRGQNVNCGACNGTGKAQPVGEPTPDDLGYASHPFSAMPLEPEAVDATAQHRITKDGWEGFNMRERQRLLDRRALALEDRMRLAWGDAQRLRLDVSGSLAAIDRIVASMERRTDQTKDAA